MKKLSQVIRGFLSWNRKHRSKGTVEQYRLHLKSFLEKIGNKPIEEITKSDVISWGNGWHQLQAVKRLFLWASQEAEIIERPPFKRLTLPPTGGRKRILTRAELLRLIRVNSPDMRRILIALRETLARPQEMRQARWNNIYWDNKPNGLKEALESGQALFVFHRYKGQARRKDPSAPRIIPISQRLGRLLARMASKKRYLGGRIFKTSSGRPWSKNTLALRIKWARKKLGLRKDESGENVVPYTIRHTMATLASSKGIRDRILSELMGHTSPRTTYRYQHLQAPDLVNALKILGQKKTGPRIKPPGGQGI